MQKKLSTDHCDQGLCALPVDPAGDLYLPLQAHVIGSRSALTIWRRKVFEGYELRVN